MADSQPAGVRLEEEAQGLGVPGLVSTAKTWETLDNGEPLEDS